MREGEREGMKEGEREKEGWEREGEKEREMRRRRRKKREGLVRYWRQDIVLHKTVCKHSMVFHVLPAKKLFLHSKSLFVISLKAITLGQLLSGESRHTNSHYTVSRACSVIDEELCPYEEAHDMLRREAIWWLFGKGEMEVSKAQ